MFIPAAFLKLSSTLFPTSEYFTTSVPRKSALISHLESRGKLLAPGPKRRLQEAQKVQKGRPWTTGMSTSLNL